MSGILSVPSVQPLHLLFIRFLQMKHENGLHLFWKHAHGMHTGSCFLSPWPWFPSVWLCKEERTKLLDASRDGSGINTTQIRRWFCCNVHIIYIFTFPFQIQPFLATTLRLTLVKQVACCSWKETQNKNKTMPSRCSPPLEDFLVHHSRF